MSTAKKPLVLVIMDGWGYSTKQEHNAVAAAKTPNLDRLARDYTSTLISGSGLDVGLPDGQMGNSEVGHVNIGAGRIVYQELTRISKDIQDGDFFQNVELGKAVDAAVTKGKAVHIMGLMSPGGVHSHEEHIMGMIEMAAKRGAEQIYFHAFKIDRDAVLESQLRDGRITVREFIRSLLLSRKFRDDFYRCNSNYRMVDQLVGRVLGRPVHGDAERIALSILIAQQGLPSPRSSSSLSPSASDTGLLVNDRSLTKRMTCLHAPSPIRPVSIPTALPPAATGWPISRSVGCWVTILTSICL